MVDAESCLEWGSHRVSMLGWARVERGLRGRSRFDPLSIQAYGVDPECSLSIQASRVDPESIQGRSRHTGSLSRVYPGIHGTSRVDSGLIQSYRVESESTHGRLTLSGLIPSRYTGDPVSLVHFCFISFSFLVYSQLILSSHMIHLF